MLIRINTSGELQEIPNAIEVIWTDEKLRIRSVDGQRIEFDSADIISIHRSETNYEDSFAIALHSSDSDS